MRDRALPAVARMAAGLQQIVKADEVGFDVHVRVVDGIAHPGLRRQIDDDLRLIPVKQRGHGRSVGQIPAHEGEAAARRGARLSQLFQPPEPIFLERDLVIVVHAVDADDMHALVLLQQRLRQEGPDEARGARDQNGPVVQLHVFVRLPSQASPCRGTKT